MLHLIHAIFFKIDRFKIEPSFYFNKEEKISSKLSQFLSTILLVYLIFTLYE